MKKKKTMIELAHLLLANQVKKDHILVDATMGNGHDTLYLSSLAQHVYSFDIQQKALDSTYEKVSHLSNVSLILDSFENIFNHVSTFDGIVFNLGYLPNGDKSITTIGETTLFTVKKILSTLEHVYMVIVVYPGHLEGQYESKLLDEFVLSLTIPVIKIQVENRKNAPYIYFIEK